MEKENRMEMVSVPKERYDRLIEQEKLLQALQDAGVDNWEGYDFACDSLGE